jgi:hypothetical protein
MIDARQPDLGILAKLVVGLAASFVIAGVLWNGISVDDLRRLWHDLLDRPSGPMSFRFILQPAMAMIAAIRDGLRDARAGRAPFFWALLSSSNDRMGGLREGLVATARIILLGLGMDVIYQILVLKTFYPNEAVIIAFVLAFVPYVLTRGGITRASQWLRNRSPPEI